MDFEIPITTTETQALIGMVHYYRGMWTMRSHILSPMTEAVSGIRGRKILWNDE